MRILLAVIMVLAVMPDAWAALGVRRYTYKSGDVVDPVEVNTNESDVYDYLRSGVDTYVDGSIVGADFADGAVTTAKVAASAITSAELASGAVGVTDLGNDSVDGKKLSVAPESRGAILYYGGEEWQAFPIGVSGRVLRSNGSLPNWSSVSFPADVTPTPSADDQAIISDSASAVTWRTVPNCTDTGGNHLNYTQSTNAFSCGTTGAASNNLCQVGQFSRDTASASGDQTVTGLGLTPDTLVFFMRQDTSDEASLGVDDGTTNNSMYLDGTGASQVWGNVGNAIHDFEAGSTSYAGNVTALASGQFTVTWTRTGAPTGTITIDYHACQ